MRSDKVLELLEQPSARGQLEKLTLYRGLLATNEGLKERLA